MTGLNFGVNIMDIKKIKFKVSYDGVLKANDIWSLLQLVEDEGYEVDVEIEKENEDG